MQNLLQPFLSDLRVVTIWSVLQYFTPAILELSGYRDKRSALLISLGPAAVNALGTLVGMRFIDHAGRRHAL